MLDLLLCDLGWGLKRCGGAVRLGVREVEEEEGEGVW